MVKNYMGTIQKCKLFGYFIIAAYIVTALVISIRFLTSGHSLAHYIMIIEGFVCMLCFAILFKASQCQ